ncbi:unnamed protein product [Acidocella sp. C78]|nr:unnamed protein product [Acidocella sp. C78]
MTRMSHETAPDSSRRRAVVDLGSNSVRLVVFQGESRNPMQIFNEKAVPRLARGLIRTGRLDDAAMDETVTVMRRYGAIARAMGAAPFEALATSAVRDAANGAAFVARLEAEIPGLRVIVLSGEEEARLSAEGFCAAFRARMAFWPIWAAARSNSSVCPRGGSARPRRCRSG